MVKNYNEILYNNQRIETSRMVLRKFTPDDAVDMLEYASDAKAIKYQGWDGCSTLEEAKLEIVNNYWAKSHANFWAVELKDTGKMIGSFDLQIFYTQDRAGFGVMLNRKYWGKGYGTEGLAVLMKLCFEKLNVNRMSAGHFAGNEASGRVMEKCGMKLEGITADGAIIKGAFLDVFIYGITRKMYYEIRGAMNDKKL